MASTVPIDGAGIVWAPFDRGPLMIGQLELIDPLDRERRMMSAVLKHSPVGVMLEDSSGLIVYINPAIRTIYRLPASQIANKTPSAVFAAAGATMIDGTEPDEALELRLANPDRIVQVRRVVIPDGDAQGAGVLTLHEDVTSSRLALEAKDLMLRTIGHEVRSPAAAIKATLAGMLQWEASMDPASRTKLLREAYESSDRLLALVENQLTIAKLEAGQFVPESEAVDIPRALKAVIGLLKHRFGDRVECVDVRLASELPRAQVVPTHLEQVLTNLVGNALEYTSNTISVSARQASRGWLEITVTDHGPGLPRSRVDSPFEKFGNAKRHRSQGGLGLGLYLCRLLVERSFGGKIWVSASGPDGTSFKFTARAAAPNIQPRIALASEM